MDSLSGAEARGRVAWSLGHHVDLEAEGFAARPIGGPFEFGALVGLSGRF